MCGCDPHANRVLETIDECGLVITRPVALPAIPGGAPSVARLLETIGKLRPRTEWEMTYEMPEFQLPYWAILGPTRERGSCFFDENDAHYHFACDPVVIRALCLAYQAMTSAGVATPDGPVGSEQERGAGAGSGEQSRPVEESP